MFRRRASKGFFAVDTLRGSRRYGCLMLSLQDAPADDFHLGGRGWARFKQSEMRYIHGDYDLYGLIDLRQRCRRRRCQARLALRSPRVLHERLHGMTHHFSERFPQIQQFLNNGFGCEMIQHASQDHVAHQGDLLYVFYPEGHMYQVDASADAIREIYQLLFNQEVTQLERRLPGAKIGPVAARDRRQQPARVRLLRRLRICSTPSCSTTSPSLITITSSAMNRTTARSWLMKM